jgi:hypothetical protein
MLPQIYQDNAELLNKIPLNEISEVISGTYTTSTYQSDD